MSSSDKETTIGGVHLESGQVVIAGTWADVATQQALARIRERQAEHIETEQKHQRLVRLHSFIPRDMRQALPELQNSSEAGTYNNNQAAAFVWIDLQGSGAKMHAQDGAPTLIRKWNKILAASRSAMRTHGAEEVFFAGDAVLIRVPVHQDCSLEAASHHALALAQKLQPIFNSGLEWQFRMAVGNTNDGEVIDVKTKNIAQACYGPVLVPVMAAESEGTVGRVMVTRGVKGLFPNEYFEDLPAKKRDGQLVPALAALPPSPNGHHSPTVEQRNFELLEEQKLFLQDHIPAEITDRTIEEDRLVSVVFLEMELPTELQPTEVVAVVSTLKRLTEAYGGFLKINATEEGEMKPMVYFGATGAPDPHSAVEFAFQSIQQLQKIHPDIEAKAAVATKTAFVGEIGTDDFRERTVIGDASLDAARLVHAERVTWGMVVVDDNTKESLEKDNAAEVSSHEAQVKAWSGIVHEVLRFSPKTLNRAVAYGQEEQIGKLKNMIVNNTRELITLDGPAGSGNRFLPLFAYADALNQLKEAPDSSPAISHYVLPSWAAHIRYFAVRHLFREGIEVSFSVEDQLDDPLLAELIIDELKKRETPLVLYIDEAQRLDDDSRELLEKISAEPELKVTIILNSNEDKGEKTVAVRTRYLSTEAEFVGFLQSYLMSQGVHTNLSQDARLGELAKTLVNITVPQEALVDICQLATIRHKASTEFEEWVHEIQSADLRQIAQVRFSMLDEISPNGRVDVLKKFIDAAAILSLGENSPFSIETATQLTNTRSSDSGASFSREDLEFLIANNYVVIQRDSGDTAILSMGMAKNRYQALATEDKVKLHQSYLNQAVDETRQTLHTLTARSVHAQAILSLQEHAQATAQQLRQALQVITTAAEGAFDQDEYRVSAEEYEALLRLANTPQYQKLLSEDSSSDEGMPELDSTYFDQGISLRYAGLSERALTAMQHSLSAHEEKFGADTTLLTQDSNTLLARGRIINGLVIVCEGDQQLRAQYIKRLEVIVQAFPTTEVKDSTSAKALIKYLSNIRSFSLQLENDLKVSPHQVVTTNRQVEQLLQKFFHVFKAAEQDREFLAIEVANMANYYWLLGNEYHEAHNEALAQACYGHAEQLCAGVILDVCEGSEFIALGWLAENLAMIGLRKSNPNIPLSQEWFRTGLQFAVKKKNMSDILSMIEEGRQQTPPLTPQGDLETDPYVQEALRLLAQTES